MAQGSCSPPARQATSTFEVRRHRSRRQQPPPDRHGRRHAPWIPPSHRRSPVFQGLEEGMAGGFPRAARRRSARTGCSPIRPGCRRRFLLTSVSPDERSALGTYTDPQSSGMAVVPLDGPGPVRRFPSNLHAGARASVPPGRRADTRSKTWSSETGRQTSGGFRSTAPRRRPVTTFTSEQILNYRWSRDGKMLAMSRGTQSADVVLITSEETDRKGAGSH